MIRDRLKFVSEKTQDRITRRGITLEQIEYCVHNHGHTYQTRGDTVYVATLEDGREMKVTIRPGSEDRIVNAFFRKV